MFRLHGIPHLQTAVAAALFITVGTLAPPSHGQSHFTECSSVTGDDATLVIPTSISPRIEGSAIANNDEIAVFTPGGICAGVGVWNGNNLGITIWGDDAITEDVVEGFVGGETLHFRIWDRSRNREYGGSYGAVVVTYASNSPVLNSSGKYSSNAIYELASLRAVAAPSAPELVSPNNGATGLEMPVTLSWRAVTGGHSYDVQVATSSSFNNVVTERQGVIGTSAPVSGLSADRTYYWRVRAVSSDGMAGSYSSPFRFTTLANAPDLPTLAGPDDGERNLPLSVRLEWESVIGANSYGLQVSTNDDFGTIDVVDEENLTSTSYSLSGLDHGETYYWRVRALNGGVSSDWTTARSFTTIARHSLPLTRGWNMISSYIEPQDVAFSSVMASIADELVLAKDGMGGIYWPDRGISTLNKWEPTRAYVIYVMDSANLDLLGGEIPSNSNGIPLRPGWNTVAFWGRSPMNVEQAVQNILSSVVAVKDISGRVFLPSEDVDILQSMRPGSGYLVYVTREVELTYPSSAETSSSTEKRVASSSTATELVGSATTGLAGSATMIVSAPFLEDGEAVVARSGSREIGRGTVLDGRAVVVLRADDPITDNVDGAREGDPISLSRANGLIEAPLNVSQIEDVLTLESLSVTDLAYSENAIWAIQAGEGDVPTEYRLDANYPNPFNPTTTIGYSLIEAGQTTLTIYNMLGQRVAVVVDEMQQPGTYEIAFDAGNLPSGTYVYHLKSGGFSRYRQMILAK